jgi:hypothetical protein
MTINSYIVTLSDGTNVYTTGTSADVAIDKVIKANPYIPKSAIVGVKLKQKIYESDLTL